VAFRPEKLREAREALQEHGRPVSQERFAELIGVSRRSPGRWENREAEPRMAQLVRIAAVTGKPIGFFFDEPRKATVGEPAMVADLLERVAEGINGIARELRGEREEVGA
jgi:transcriptional regulator with XRE-family HTH domain